VDLRVRVEVRIYILFLLFVFAAEISASPVANRFFPKGYKQSFGSRLFSGFPTEAGAAYDLVAHDGANRLFGRPFLSQ
jgi:hypothetical protein